MRPSAMTRMRSASPISSGISDEIKQHADAARSEVGDHLVDLRLGADVDAARRLVEDEHFELPRQPARQHHLLLVAARQLARPSWSRLGVRIDSASTKRPTTANALRRSNRPAVDTLLGHAQRRIVEDRAGEQQRLALAVLRREADAGGDRGGDVVGRKRFAVDDDLAGQPAVEADDGAGELGAAGAHQPADAEHLAAMQRQIDVVDGLRAEAGNREDGVMACCLLRGGRDPSARARPSAARSRAR